MEEIELFFHVKFEIPDITISVKDLTFAFVMIYGVLNLTMGTWL